MLELLVSAAYYTAFACDANIYSYLGASKNLDNDANNPSGDAPHTRNQILHYNQLKKQKEQYLIY